MSKVILVGGYPGCGKDSVGRGIAQAIGAMYLNKNSLTDQALDNLLASCADGDYEQAVGLYEDRVQQFVYAGLMKSALENAKIGNSVVCCASFKTQLNDKGWVKQMQICTNTLGCDLEMVWVHSDEASAKKRLKADKSRRSKAHLENWTKFLASNSYEVPGISEAAHIIDGSSTSSESLPLQVDKYIDGLRSR